MSSQPSSLPSCTWRTLPRTLQKPSFARCGCHICGQGHDEAMIPLTLHTLQATPSPRRLSMVHTGQSVHPCTLALALMPLPGDRPTKNLWACVAADKGIQQELRGQDWLSSRIRGHSHREWLRNHQGGGGDFLRFARGQGLAALCRGLPFCPLAFLSTCLVSPCFVFE